MSEHECACEEALDRLELYLDAEIGAVDAARLRQHLADCAPCLDAAQYEQRLRSLVRRSCGETAPEELHVRVRTQITVIRTEIYGR